MASTMGKGTIVDRLAQLREKRSEHQDTSAHTSVSVSKETKTPVPVTSETERVNLEIKKTNKLQMEIDLLSQKTTAIDSGQLEMKKMRLKADLLTLQHQIEQLKTTNEK